MYRVNNHERVIKRIMGSDRLLKLLTSNARVVLFKECYRKIGTHCDLSAALELSWYWCYKTEIDIKTSAIQGNYPSGIFRLRYLVYDRAFIIFCLRGRNTGHRGHTLIGWNVGIIILHIFMHMLIKESL